MVVLVAVASCGTNGGATGRFLFPNLHNDHDEDSFLIRFLCQKTESHWQYFATLILFPSRPVFSPFSNDVFSSSACTKCLQKL